MTQPRSLHVVIYERYRGHFSFHGAYVERMKSAFTVQDLKSRVAERFPGLCRLVDAIELSVFRSFNDMEESLNPVAHTELLMNFESASWKRIAVVVPRFDKPSGFRDLQYKALADIASCRRFLDAVARKLCVRFKITPVGISATMGDIFHARMHGRRELRASLNAFFTTEEWDFLKSIDTHTTENLHLIVLPLTKDGKPYVIIPVEFCTDGNIELCKQIAVSIELVVNENDIVVLRETDVSTSSSSASSFRVHPD